MHLSEGIETVLPVNPCEWNKTLLLQISLPILQVSVLGLRDGHQGEIRPYLVLDCHLEWAFTHDTALLRYDRGVSQVVGQLQRPRQHPRYG